MPRSIPIYLDRLYHIRYDLAAIWDAEHIVPGGFVSLWDRDWDKAGFAATRLLFWLGTRHERDVSLEEIGGMLQYNIDIDKIKLIDVYIACSDALYLAGWFVRLDKPKKSDDDKKTFKDRILEIEETATKFLNISLTELWSLTPVEINELIDASLLKHELRTGVKTLSPAKPRRQSDDELKNMIRNAFG